MLAAKSLYDKSRELLVEIDSLLAGELDQIIPRELPQNHCNIIASSSLRMNRLDPHMYESYSNHLLMEIERYGSVPLGEIAIPWTVPRFKRNYLDRNNPNAVPLYSSSDIVRANYSASKFISRKMNARNISLCVVQKDSVLIPCSGTYGGILGKGIMAGDLLDGKAMSQHILRIKKKSNNSIIDYYYTAAFLCSYRFGYPMIAATRFGKDIPELDPEAIKAIPIPTIPNDIQHRIGFLFLRSRDLQEEANRLENRAIVSIEKLYEECTNQNLNF